MNSRVKRMEQLYRSAARTRNPEQCEAYADRLNRHWPLHLRELEESLIRERSAAYACVFDFLNRNRA